MPVGFVLSREVIAKRLGSNQNSAAAPPVLVLRAHRLAGAVGALRRFLQGHIFIRGGVFFSSSDTGRSTWLDFSVPNEVGLYKETNPRKISYHRSRLSRAALPGVLVAEAVRRKTQKTKTTSEKYI